MSASSEATGNGVCNPMSFETFGTMQLCICANDNCNTDFPTCLSSASNLANIPSSTDFMPDLNSNSTISCIDTSDTSYTCTENSFINSVQCENYVQNHGVLCAITTNQTQTIQASLIYENYEIFLSEAIYYIKSLPSSGSYSETATTISYASSLPTFQECACTNYSLCNEDITVCSAATPLQTTTTTSALMTSTTTTSSESTISATTTTSESTTSATTTTSESTTSTTTSSESTTSATTTTSESTTSATTTTSESTTSTTTSSESTTSATSTTSESTTSATTTTSESTTSTTTSSESTTSATTTTSESTTSATTTTSESTTSPTTTSSTSMTYTSSTSASATTTQVSSTNGPNVVVGETGLGSAAKAGIACGIIFSALLFTAEIIFFKFVYSGGMGSGYDPSVAYRA